MAMTDEQRLVVSLEARMTKYEKDMARASRATNDNFRKMEGRTKRYERTMGASVGRVGRLMKGLGTGLLAGVAAGGIGGIVAQIGKVAEGVATIGDRAKQAGLDAQDFQRIAFVAEQNRIEVDDLTSGIREMQLRMNEFITSAGKSGTAAESLRRLGYNVDTIQTKLQNPLDLFTEIVGKVQTLDRASQIRIFDDLFGGDGERLVRLISEGEKGIRDQIAAAEDLGLVLNDEVIAKAEEIDRQFNIITSTVGTNLKQAIVNAASALSEFIDSFNSFQDQQDRTLDDRLAEIGKQRLAAEGQLIRLREQQDEAIPGNPFGHDYASDIASVKDRLAGLTDEENRIMDVIKRRQATQLPTVEVKAPATSTPDDPIRPSGGGERTSSIERERQAVRELIAEYEREIRMLGMSDQERRAAEASRRAGSAATDDQRQKIIQLNETLYQESRAQDQANMKAQQAARAQREFVGGLASDLLNGVPPAQALSRALSNLADTLLNEVLDAIFTVQDAGAGGGTSGSIFGGAGGLLGGLLKGIGSLFGFAEGGFTGPGTKYQPAGIVHAGEYVVSKRATDMIGVENLEALHRGALKGFAAGGYVGSAPAVHRAHMPANGNVVQAIEINAPITVEGSAGTPEQNQDLAARMSKQLEGTVRGVVADELRRQTRPGNFANRRGGR